MDEHSEALQEFLERHNLLFSFESFIETRDMSLSDFGLAYQNPTED